MVRLFYNFIHSKRRKIKASPLFFQFKPDSDIRVMGIGVYIGSGKCIVNAKLLKICGDTEETAVVVATSNEEMFDNTSKTPSPISFTIPVLIPANKWHIISALIRYCSPLKYHHWLYFMPSVIEKSRNGTELSTCGDEGEDRLEADGVSFEFRNSKLSEGSNMKVDPEHKLEVKCEEHTMQIQKLQAENEQSQTALRDIMLKYQQQHAEVEELKEKLIQSKLEALQSLKKILQFHELEKLDKLFVSIQLENGNIIYFDNVKPFQLCTVLDGKRVIADSKLLEGEFDCSFKGVIGNYAYFSSARGKIVRFFKVSITDDKIQLDLINENRENGSFFTITRIILKWKERNSSSQDFDPSENLIAIITGILYFFRENTTAKLEKLNEKVIVIEAPVLDGKLSYYTPPHSDYIYVANTDQNILITLNTTNLHVAQHSYEPPIDSTYHSIVGIHDGILTMVFEGTGFKSACDIHLLGIGIDLKNLEDIDNYAGRLSLMSPIRIPANVWHVIILNISGANTYDGRDRVESAGVVFEFRNSPPSTGTDVGSGQIAGIYFRKATEPDFKAKYEKELRTQLANVSSKSCYFELINDRQLSEIEQLNMEEIEPIVKQIEPIANLFP
ncbi:hypothetical protein PRIPAC_96434 [Pristionchus pacificus]|uniref:Uncharacterized protein n=1 Tax=Pristionchus pacificus TaxID=54126 RepID=A0A2A6B384_PRIPA|nr:hypothetical protein PRIPAC_96434 [Pristionchus pacificus]|eukprot:PDM60321.1 hypothetical protein PRIPAC_54146 [Pristionchus pacificus]